LYFEPFVLAAPKGHSILKVDKLTRNNLNAQEMTLLEEGHCLSLQTLELCSRNRRGNIQEFHATSIETLRQLVAAGLGYSLLPVLAREEDKRLKDVLEYREFDDERVGRKVILVCRKRAPNMDELLLFADFIRAHAAPQVTVLHK